MAFTMYENTTHKIYIVQTTRRIIILMKDWVGLFADYITPDGPGVNQSCIDAGKLYIKQLSQVLILICAFPKTKIVYVF